MKAASHLASLRARFERGEDTARLLPEVKDVLTEARRKKDRAAEAGTRLLLAALLHLRGAPAAALGEVARATALAEGLGRGDLLARPLLAEARLREGQALAARGGLREAARALAEAGRRFRRARDARSADKSEAERATVLRRMGRAVEADKILRRLLSRFPARLGANAAGVRVNLAHALIDQGRFAAGLAIMDEARDIFRRSTSSLGAAVCENTAGAVRLSLGLFREARDRFRSAEEGFRRAGDSLSAAKSRENRALAVLPSDPRAAASLLRASARTYARAGAVADDARAVANLLRAAPRSVAPGMAERAFQAARRAGSAREMAAVAVAAGFAVNGRAASGRTASGRTGRLARWASRAKVASNRTDSPLAKAEAEILLARAAVGSRKARHLRRALDYLARIEAEPAWALLPWTGGLHRTAWVEILRVAARTNDEDILREIHRRSRLDPLRLSYLAASGKREGGGGGRRIDIGRLAGHMPAALRSRHAAKSTPSARTSAVLEVHLDPSGLVSSLLALPGGTSRVSLEERPGIDRLLATFEDEMALAETDPTVLDDPARIASATGVLRRIARLLFGGLDRLEQVRGDLLILPSGAAHRIPFQALFALVADRSAPRVFLAIEARVAPLHGVPPRGVPPRGAPPRGRPPRGTPHPFRRPVVVLGNVAGLSAGRREAEAVAGETGARILDGARRGRSAVLAAYRESDLFYFVGHARSRPENPFLSYLDLGRGGSLFALDFLRARATRRPRVVLSACSTGDARGGVGLVPALLASGAREVLAARWRVGDDLARENASLLITGDLPRPFGRHPWAWAGWERWLG